MLIESVRFELKVYRLKRPLQVITWYGPHTGTWYCQCKELGINGKGSSGCLASSDFADQFDIKYLRKRPEVRRLVKSVRVLKRMPKCGVFGVVTYC